MDEPSRRPASLIEQARIRFDAAWTRAARRRDGGSAAAPVAPGPRSPTLSGGAAAPIDG